MKKYRVRENQADLREGDVVLLDRIVGENAWVVGIDGYNHFIPFRMLEAI